MLRPEKMQKVRIIGMRRDEPAVISFLHELSLLEIRSAKVQGAEGEVPLDVYRVVSEQLTRIRGIRSVLIPLDGAEKQKPLSLEQAVSECGKIGIDSRLKEMEIERESVEQRIDELLEESKAVKRVLSLRVDFSKAKTGGKLEVFTGVISRKKNEGLKKLLKGKNDLIYSFAPAMGGFAFSICARSGSGIRKELEEAGAEILSLPPMESTPAKHMERIEAEAEELRKSLERVNEEYVLLSEEHWENIDRVHKTLKIWEERCQKAGSFAATKEVFVAEGWLPERDYSKLHSSLVREFGEKVHLRKIHGHDEPPTKLKNPKAVSPFEFLVEFFSLPKSWEVDPSPILALTFPIVYGMMVGDVGYGLISLLIALGIILKTKPGMLQGFAKLWAIASIPSILFGIVFDEWMGFSFQHFMELFGVEVHGTFLQVFFGSSLKLVRLHDIGMLILVSVLFGVLHLSVGLLLGFINEWKHSKLHAVVKLVWIGILLSGLLMIPHLMFQTSLLNLPLDEVLAGGILFAVSLLVILKADGIIGVFEIPGIAGNALSYARIAAVGIAGVVVAEAIINELIFEGVAVPNRGSPAVFFAMTLLVLFLHALNTFLAMFESLVQGARLNLVEFYGKFFHGGGKKFEPFAMAKEEI